MITRRDFAMRCAVGLMSIAYPLRIASGHQKAPHPKPRAGITGAKVLKAAQLAEHEKLIPLFDSVRKIPHVIDGIRCNCLCAQPPAMYSLLSCFEGDAMATACAVCQGQAKLAARLHGEGKTLAEIRVAVDAKFG